MLEHPVTAFMSTFIIDDLEIVNVEQHEMELVLIFTALREVALEFEVEIAPIPGAG
jgi:hypothetical protein